MPFEAKKLKSCFEYPDIVRQRINKELQEGRIAGPFKEPPLVNMRISPLDLVPKHDPGQF